MTTRANSPRRRGWSLAVVVVALTTLIASCASLPRSGQVQSVGEKRSAGRDIQVNVPGPRPGANPTDIVRDFLWAASDVSPDYGKARAFLTHEAAATWPEEPQILIYRAESLQVSSPKSGKAVRPEPTEADTATISVSLKTSGVIDPSGQMVVANGQTKVNKDFSLVRVGGQWRISRAPDMVIMSDAQLPYSMVEQSVYFLDQQRTRLVPEPRWFLRRESLPTALMRQLLAGPSEEFSTALVTALPPGTDMAAPKAVRLKDSEAIIELTDAARDTSSQERTLMFAQIRATLLQVTGLTSISIFVDGAPLGTDPSSTVGEPVMPDDSALFGVMNNTIHRIAGPKPAEPVPDIGPVTEADVRGLAVPPAQAAGTWFALWQPGLGNIVAAEPNRPERRVLFAGGRHVPPSIDRMQWVWSAAEAPGAELVAVARDGTRRQLGRAWGADKTPVLVRVSPEGSRVVVVVRDGGGQYQIGIVGVIRDAQGQPQRVSAQRMRPVAGTFVALLEVRWLSPTSIAVLGTPTVETTAVKGAHTIVPVSLSGSVDEPLPGFPTVGGPARTFVIGRGMSPVIVQTGDRGLLERAGNVWLPLRGADRITAPAFPG